MVHSSAKPGTAFRPVPMAVPPMLTSFRRTALRSRFAISSSRLFAKALNSWPEVIGTASCSWVRPILMMSLNSWPLARKEAIRSRRAFSTWRFIRTKV